MKTELTVSILFILGAIGVFIPYSVLTISFNYPDVLRQDPEFVLKQFHNGGSSLIFTWFSFALSGLPLLVSYALIGKKLEQRLPFVRWVTTAGIISGVVQIIGLLRWVFVVPVLANDYINTNDQMTQKAIITSFKITHQLVGVLLGEHLGQLLTVVWTVGMSYAFLKLAIIPRWLGWVGFSASAIYFIAQAELLATVLPNFPYWSPAGFIGSSLWLLWLFIVGIHFAKKPAELKPV